jgi:Pectate lyase superfamily protein/Bacterial TSP3 repeat
VDVCLGSLGTTGSRSDANDTTNFRFTVNDSLPPAPIQPDGSLFIPANATDTDGDGILDVWEYYYIEPDSLVALTATGDYDSDGRTDPQEISAGTSPTDADTDDDGLSDGAEFVAGTNPKLADTDGDGLSDGAEVSTYGSNPLLADTDGDGLSDGFEVGTLTGLLTADSDGDGLSDGQEVLTHLTNPLAADTDGDGFGDAQEVASGTRPRDASSFPGSNSSKPVLSIVRNGADIVLSWPADAAAWMLCASYSLSPADWQLVPNVPVVSGGRNIVSLPAASAARFFQLRHRGALVPFTTYEAEAGTTSGGSVVQLTTLPTGTTWSPELEASGRAFAQLNNTGDRVDFVSVRAANAMVIRHCIPDAPTGGGITATLSVYVNGTFRQKLTLSSKHNWLYGDGAAGTNGQSNDPTIANATPHVFWDESRTSIAGELQAGDTLRLQKDADDTAGFYRIDLVDLETAPPPLLPPPAGSYLSVADFGADGSDANDDTTAIQSCVTDAKAQGKHVWLPPGTYYQSASITIDGISFLGAGMWHTALIATPASLNQLRPAGTGPRIADVYLENTAQSERGPSGYAVLNSGTVTNWTIENVWITHTITGPWVGGSNGIVRGCRIRSTFADGIHTNGSDLLIENNHIRGTGDDGIALYSQTASPEPVNTDCTARFNTVIATYWGQNASRGGGTNMVFEDNYLADNARAAAFSITHSTVFPVNPSVGGSFRRNTVVRGGGNASNQKRGAIWIFPGGPAGTTISGVTISDNDIRDSIFRGIHLVGGQNQEITFERNVVDSAGDHGILIEAVAVGLGVFTNNVVRGINAGFSPFVNNGGSDYTAPQSGNSWQ